MRRDKLKELLKSVEIEVTGRTAFISNKSCEDIADFIQEELVEQRKRDYKKKQREENP